jgi:hypothetical protein
MGTPSNNVSQTPAAGDQANFAATDALGSAVASAKLASPYGWFNFSVSGTFSATVILQKSFDGGTTWIAATIQGSTSAVSATAPAAFVLFEPERGMLYRADVSAYTSGTANTRISGNGLMAQSAGY